MTGKSYKSVKKRSEWTISGFCLVLSLSSHWGSSFYAIYLRILVSNAMFVPVCILFNTKRVSPFTFPNT